MWAQERAWLVKPRQEKIGQIWNVGTSQRPSMLHNVRNAGHGPVWMMVIMTDDDMQSEEDGIGHHGHWGPLALFWTRMLAFGRYHDDNCFETALTKVLRSVGQCLECCSQLAGLSQLWQGLLWALDGSLKDGNNHYCHWQQSSYQAVWHHYRGLCSHCSAHSLNGWSDLRKRKIA